MVNSHKIWGRKTEEEEEEDLFPWKSPNGSKSNSNRWIHMSAGDMSDGVNHHRDNQSTGN